MIWQIRRGAAKNPSGWVQALLERKPAKLAAVALANKMARIGPVERIGVCPVRERIGEAVQGKLRNLGSDETVDRIAVVAGD